MTDTATLLAVAATFFAAGLIKGVLGLGMPIVVLSSLPLVIGLKSSLALMVVPGVVMNVWQSLAGPAFRANLARFWPMWLITVFSVWAGTYALAIVDAGPVTVVLGVILTTYAVLSLVRPRIPPPERWEVWLGPLVGAVSGFLFGLAGTWMVPGVLYLEALGLNRDAFVQALGMTFVVITASLGVGLLSNGLLTGELLAVSAGSLAPMAVGLLIGRAIRNRVPEALFRKLFFIWLALTGVFIAAQIYL